MTEHLDPAPVADTAPAADPAPITRSVPVEPERTAPSVARTVGGATAGGRYRSLGEFVKAAALGEIEQAEYDRYTRSMNPDNWAPDPSNPTRLRALDSGITSEQTGLVHESWIAQVIDLVRQYTPTVEAFSQRPLPEDGDDVKMPAVTTRPTVAVQTEGAEVESTAAIITPVTWSKATYAGGQNISIQTLRWSSPSYLDAVVALHIKAMAQAVNAAAVTALEAAIPGAGTPGTGHVIDATADFRDDLVDASALILAGLKTFPDVVLLPTANWVTLAKTDATDGRPLYAALAPTNAAGTVAVSLSGQTLNIPFVVEPELTSTLAVVAKRDAFVTMRSGVSTLAADVVSTLGRDVAVYQFAAMGAVDANGLAAIDGSA